MQIQINTLQHIRDNRVKLEIIIDQGEVYTSEQVAHYQATEAELVAGPLRREVDELKKTLAESRDLVEFKNTTIEQLQTEIDQRHQLLREATHKLGEIQQLVDHEDATKAIKDQHQYAAQDLAHTVTNIREVLSSSPSSQA